MVDKVLDIQFYFHHHFKHSLHNIKLPKPLPVPPASSSLFLLPSIFSYCHSTYYWIGQVHLGFSI